MGWSRKYFACPFVFKQGPHEYYCLICGCVIYGYTAFRNHVHGKRHTTSVEQYGCDVTALKDDYYYCRRCDCIVPYYTNIFSHLTGKRHQSLLNTESRMFNWSSCDYFVCPFVSIEGYDNYYCMICGCYISGHAIFLNHIHGKLHSIAERMFGCDISPLGEDCYYCARCNCNIPHYKNVYDHIVGQRHQNLLDEGNEQRQGVDEEAEPKETRVKRVTSSENAESTKFATSTEELYGNNYEEQNQHFLRQRNVSNDRDNGNEETDETRVKSAMSFARAESPNSVTFTEESCVDSDEEKDANLVDERSKLHNRDNEIEETKETRDERLDIAESSKFPTFSEHFWELIVGKYNLLDELDDHKNWVRTRNNKTGRSANFTEDVYNHFVGRNNRNLPHELNEQDNQEAGENNAQTPKNDIFSTDQRNRNLSRERDEENKQETPKSNTFSKDVFDRFIGPRNRNLSYEINEQNNEVAGKEEAEERSVQNKKSSNLKHKIEETKLKSSINSENSVSPRSPTFSEDFSERVVDQQKLLNELNEQYTRDADKGSAKTPKSSTIPEDVYDHFMDKRNKNVSHEPNDEDNSEASEEEIVNKSRENVTELMASQKSSILVENIPRNDIAEKNLYERIATKNSRDYERAKSSRKAEKPKKLQEILTANYTIFRHPVDGETKRQRKDFVWKKISNKVEPRLNLSSWQVSSCKNVLQNTNTEKNEANNSICNNIADMVETSTEGDVDSNETVVTDAQSLSSKIIALTKFAKQLSLARKNAEDDASLEQNSSKVSATNDLELLINTSSSLSDKSDCFETDINGNSRSNAVLKNYRSKDRAIAKLLLTSKVNDFVSEDSTVNRFDPSTNDSSSNPAVSSPNIDEDSSSKRIISRESCPKKISTQQFLDEDIYDMNSKKRATKLDMKLSLVVDSRTICCLVCRKFLSVDEVDYIDHLAEIEHCDCLDDKKKDHALFELLPGEYSELYLAHQYMIEMSCDTVYCIVCDENICNINYKLQRHMRTDSHRRSREDMYARANERFDLAESRMQCDWYKIQKYRCVLCEANFYTDVKFVEHLTDTQHADAAKNVERELIYDFCTVCATLWYGYRCTYGNHCDSSSHKWLAIQSKYETTELSEGARKLLATPDKYAEEVVELLDLVNAEKDKMIETLIEDLEKTTKLIFSRAKAYASRSRLHGFASPDRDIDVFLDCENTYDKEISSHQILYFATIVHKHLSDDPTSWNTEDRTSCDRSHTIQVHHRRTELSCRIFFENGLAVESSKLIKSIINNFPMCRKLLIVLEQWLAQCNLSGFEGITSYALYWLVIFYLQKESIIPSIARLIAIEGKSHIVAGWEVGVSYDYVDNKARPAIDIKGLLIGFFMFYENFDFRHDVVCPLLGETVKIRTFNDYQNLPREMKPYVAYMNSSNFPEPFRIDTAACVQDPFNLRENITELVNKAHLSKFRTCCSKSLLLLSSSSM